MISNFISELSKFVYGVSSLNEDTLILMGSNDNNNDIHGNSTASSSFMINDTTRRIILDNICKNGDVAAFNYVFQFSNNNNNNNNNNNDDDDDDRNETNNQNNNNKENKDDKNDENENNVQDTENKIGNGPFESSDFARHILPFPIRILNMKNQSTGRSPLHYLIRFERVEMMKMLLSSQSITATKNTSNKNISNNSSYDLLNFETRSVCKWNLFHDCAKNGNVALLELLLGEMSSAVVLKLMSEANNFGSTPIHLSLVHKNFEIARRFVQYVSQCLTLIVETSASSSSTSVSSASSLPLSALSSSSLSLVKVLDIFSVLNCIHRNVIQMTIDRKLGDLCDSMFQCVKTAETLLYLHKEQQNLKSSVTATTLGSIVTRTDQSPSFLKMLQSADSMGARLIHYCCVQPNDNMFSQLYKFIQFGHTLDCFYHNTRGYAPTILRLLISKDLVGNTPFHYAMGSNSKFCLMLLFRYFAVTVFERQKQRLPFLTNRNIQQEKQKGSGNPVNLLNNAGESALYIACRKKCRETIEYFFSCQANHEHDLLVKIASCVDKKDIDQDFLETNIKCKTPAQQQFMDKCYSAVKADKDSLTNRHGTSCFSTDETRELLDIITTLRKN